MGIVESRPIPGGASTFLFTVWLKFQIQIMKPTLQALPPCSTRSSIPVHAFCNPVLASPPHEGPAHRYGLPLPEQGAAEKLTFP